ncbi:hypothetical protein BCF11_1167 [Collimonas sp. PA-H2]|uniref:hypothetical protein n=1 Tax=Collimonas sp. PA-H2 TaxID=1881062 RepID=UPI000BF89950|nr:hypothetical protein [Collimonas sp. PA-H2]PFH08792.1 hypothetical protein BCF11_1167 [Collimonas sp. PA-H2]
MNATQAATKKNNMTERAKGLRENFFPEVAQEWLWLRKRNDGFTTIPRTLAIVMAIIDSLSKNKPCGLTYFVLWCRAWDDPMLTIENPAIFAAEAGFSGERAVVTWRQRMKALSDLGFIKCKEGSAGEFHYVLILNPHLVIWKQKSSIAESLLMRLYERGHEIGAKDIVNPEAALIPKPSIPPASIAGVMLSGVAPVLPVVPPPPTSVSSATEAQIKGLAAGELFGGDSDI